MPRTVSVRAEARNLQELVLIEIHGGENVLRLLGHSVDIGLGCFSLSEIHVDGALEIRETAHPASWIR